ncbi:UvrB/UvrC motif-containing protein [Neobacillus drentensis]|uniref:UvrB/UvrC motif-containing protein n=1 Tax=Neobacillus drentensis TaxID=220684 RepID=UPI002FFFDC8E
MREKSFKEAIPVVLKKKVKDLPSSPGVYLMKDSSDRVIYVGKAKNLKNRVRSYFQNTKAHSQKIKKLKANVNDFQLILTDTEFEAFMLECKLIKEIKPIFNKKMKNPTSYTYIRFHKRNTHWTIDLSNTIEKDGSLYFGPYPSKHVVEKALQGMKEFLKIDCCNPNKGTPCLNYSLGLCIGICFNEDSCKQYNEQLKKMVDFLQGTNSEVLQKLTQKMIDASNNFDFEIAAKYRDTLDAIQSLIYKEKVIEFTEANKNIALIEYIEDAALKLFLIKGNNVIFREKYQIDEENSEQLVEKIKANIFTYFKSLSNHSSIEITKDEIDDAQIIYSYLNSSSCKHVVIDEKWLEFENQKSIDSSIRNTLLN